MTPGTPVFPTGAVINGRYEVQAFLGGGSFGKVYQVFDHQQHEVSALKLIYAPGLTGPWHEAQVLTGVRGEHILPIRNADHASGVPFIVTEVARHGSLAGQITPQGLGEHEAVRWTRHACRGVQRLHDLRLLHNDIKPENIFLDDQGDSLIGDMGLATLLDASDHSPVVGGTAETMAPEVADICLRIPAPTWTAHRPATPASDVYGLGATLYWLLAGRPGHQDVTGFAATLALVVAGPPPPIRDLVPYVGQALAERIQRSMAVDPAARYATPADFDAALGQLSTPQRAWRQQVPHPGHSACYVGRAATRSDVGICAIPSGKGTAHRVVATTLPSGRRISAACRDVARMSALPQALRVAMGKAS